MPMGCRLDTPDGKQPIRETYRRKNWGGRYAFWQGNVYICGAASAQSVWLRQCSFSWVFPSEQLLML